DALAQYYADVPVGSVVWGIGKFAAQPPPRGNSLISNALRKLMAGTMLVGSALYVPSTNGGTLEWRTKACAATEEQARQIADQLGTSLRLYYSITLELGKQGRNPDLDAAINSLRVEQQGKCAILSADVPARLMQKLAQNSEQ